MKTFIWLQNQQKYIATYGISSSTSRYPVTFKISNHGGLTGRFDVLPVPERSFTPCCRTIHRTTAPTKQSNSALSAFFFINHTMILIIRGAWEKPYPQKPYPSRQNVTFLDFPEFQRVHFHQSEPFEEQNGCGAGAQPGGPSQGKNNSNGRCS